jgi:hypothetical protein
MTSHLRGTLAVFLLLTLGAFLALGQVETGRITGTVTDPTGAVVPGATITVKSIATGTERVTTTNTQGVYAVTGLIAGPYEVSVTSKGFKTEQRRVRVMVGSTIGMNFKLSLGETTTVVEVSAEGTSAEVDTETQTIGNYIGQKSVSELPTLTRDPYDLVLTAGNVSSADPAKETNSVGQGVGVAINGQRASSVNILLDGADNTNAFDTTPGQAVPLDSVQEFSVLTNDFQAQYGRASGGVVNVITKSGTNEFHGSAYEFNRVSDLASNSFDNNANGIKKPVFTRNQFGYSVGGPIKKNKVFFFQSTEWTRVRSAATRFSWVPTSNLIGAASPNTQSFFSNLGGLRSNLTQLNTVSRNDLLAQGFDPCTGAAASGPCALLPADMPLFQRVAYNFPFNSGGGDPQNSYDLVGRIDWYSTEKTQVYGRYALQSEDYLAGSLADSPYQGYDTGEKIFNNNFLVSMIHTFSPTTSSQSKIVFNRLSDNQPLSDRGVVPSLYFFQNQTASFLGTKVAFPGYLPFSPATGIPFGGPQNYAQAYEDLTYVHGTHQLRFGGSYVYLRDNRTFGAYEEAQQILGQTFGNSLDNFLSGQLYRFRGAIDPQGKFPCGDVVTPNCVVDLPVSSPSFSRSNRYNEFGIYGQDSWRVHPRVTLNLGLRWEYYGVQHNKDPRLDSNFYDANAGTIFQSIRDGNVAIAPLSTVGGLWAKDWNNFAPRLGFAWDVFGNGKTAIRGGYGIGYERNFGNVTFNVIQNPPNYAVMDLIAGVDLPSLSVTPDNAGPLSGATGQKALPVTSLRNVDANIRTAYAHFYSFSLDQQVVRNVFLGIDYSGSRGESLYSLEDPNQIGAGNVYLNDPCTPGLTPGDPGTCTARLKTTQYSFLNRRGNNGFSRYNAMNVRVDIRNVANSGLDLRTNYTWSHAIDNLSSVFSVAYNDLNLGLLDPFNPKLDTGDAEFDIRQRVAISGIWNIPFAKNTMGIHKRVLDGWTIAPIFTANTGTPFSLFDTSNAYVIAPRAMFNGPVPNNGVSNPPPGGTPNTFNWITIPAGSVDHSYVNPLINIADIGPFPANMSGRNAFRGPGRWNLDLGIYKNFQVTERYSLQLRGEMYNMFNHSNLILVGSDNDVSAISAATVQRGVLPTGLTERRNVQFALKFIF